MRQLLKKIPFLRKAKRTVKKIRKAYDRRFGPARLKRMLEASPHPKVVIGSADRCGPGWIPTQEDFLNLVEPADWERFFRPNSIAAMLAEHVWEHLTKEEAQEAARRCFEYLQPGGYLRIAVPDGLHPDPAYLGWVRPGGASPGQISNDHKVLYTYRSATELFESSGFRVKLYEYFDEAGTFHHYPWDERAGKIWRSEQFDKRNVGGSLTFTSIILDAFKA
jgi:predicted SAM-dependent methyltransferase